MAVVLVVDDEEPIVEVVAELVEEHGHTAIRAFNGARALEQARVHRPALIISDVMMPVMDGYALLRALRAAPELAHTAVYLMSAASFHLPADASPDGFLPKPFDLGALDGLLAGLAPKGKQAGR